MGDVVLDHVAVEHDGAVQGQAGGVGDPVDVVGEGAHEVAGVEAVAVAGLGVDGDGAGPADNDGIDVDGGDLGRGVAQPARGAQGADGGTPLVFLAGISLASLALMPFAGAAALRVNLR